MSENQRLEITASSSNRSDMIVNTDQSTDWLTKPYWSTQIHNHLQQQLTKHVCTTTFCAHCNLPL